MTKRVKAWAVVDKDGNIVSKSISDCFAWATKYQAMRFSGGKPFGERVVPVTIIVEEK